MTISINARPIEDWNLVPLRGLRGWADYPATSLELLAAAGVVGRFANAGGMTADARTIVVRVKLQPTTLAGRKAALSAFYQGIGGQLVALTFDDGPTREVFAVLLEGEAGGPTAGAAELLDPEAVVTLRFVAPDPLYYETTLYTVAVPPATPVDVPVGEAGARAELLIAGVTTATTITIRSGRTGAVLYQMTLTGSITSSQWLRLAITRQWIRLASGNPYTETDAYSRKGSVEVWPRFDPRDAPTLEISQGDALLVGKRAYLA